MQRCPQCDVENADDRTVCEACGATLESRQEEGPVGSLPEGPIRVEPAQVDEHPPVEPVEEPRTQTVEDGTPGETPVVPMPETAPAPPVVPPPPASGVYTTPPPPPGATYPMTGGASPQTPTATWALITGIAAIVCCGPLGIVAIILAQQAKRESPANWSMAQAGMILGIIGLAIMGLTLLFYFGVFLFSVPSFHPGTP